MMLIRAVLLATSLLAPTMLHAEPSEAARYGDQARDRAAILKMAGTYKVTFDFRETTPLVAGYTAFPAKVSGGHEVVRAIVDTPDLISLQHLLVVEDGNGKTMVIKHWRQDWRWQPADVLVYAAKGRWTVRPVAIDERRGAWSQTVWQTDDSPRYGGVGRWRYDGGVARWTSDETRRPLARRDAVRKPAYDHYLGTNHHVLTPAGWVHEQENTKFGTRDGQPVAYVREYVVNTYAPDPNFQIAAADEYWDRTKEYWAAVRADWDAAVRRGGGVTLGEEPDNGSVTGHELMLIADDVASGESKLAAATAEAKGIIDKAVATPAG